MKTSVKKPLALCLSAALAIGGISGAVRANAGENSPNGAEKPPVAAAETAAAAPAAFRDETVYVLAGADGGVKKVIVSDWLKNPEGLSRLEDAASLRQVENVKGYEDFSENGGVRVWNAAGNDLYTQGETDQEVPVEVKVSYTLDGKAIEPSRLAGKSGKVSIRFDYVNRQYETVEINGKPEKIYVPFAVLTGLALDNERFSNIAVENGRLYNDGDRTAVIGLALPGVRESLGIDAGDVDLPEFMEITADAADFELETTFTAAVCDPFRELNTGKLNDTEDLKRSLDELTGAMDQLMDGADRLYDGLGELLEKSETLSGAVSQLSGGADALKAGGAELQAGAAQLQSGTDSLQTGLERLDAGSGTLTAGAKQIFDGLLASASQQLAASGAQVPALTAENYGRTLEGVIASMGESPAAEQVKALKASLDGCNQFYQGLLQYTAGVADASKGAGQLKAGVDSLSAGADSLGQGAARLSAGLGELNENVPALLDGVTALHDGAGDLSDGLKAFNEEGVQKIADAFDGDLELLADRLEALADAAKHYQSFSGGNEPDGQVKFIYRTGAVKSEQ